MALTAIITSLILIEYFTFGMLVGRARGRSGVAAPAVTGDPVFERYFRVHQNTLEQLVVVLPALWLFALFVSEPIGALLGAVFIVGRALYLKGYVADPAKRGAGFGIGALATIILVLGALVGAVIAYLK